METNDIMNNMRVVKETGAIAIYNNKMYRVGYYHHDYGYCLYLINDFVKLDPIWVPKNKVKIQFS